MKRNADARWTGSLKEGKGTFSTESGKVKDVAYTWSTRFGEERGTNPEEMIAAAHASCFSMAFSAELGKLGITPESVETHAAVTMEKTDAGMTVTQSHLTTTVHAAGADKGKVHDAAEAARKGCPISRLLAPSLKISLDLKVA
jgi:osmotically inducible protein OsmC